SSLVFLFLYAAPATPALYTLSLHDALPICCWPAKAIGTPSPPVATNSKNFPIRPHSKRSWRRFVFRHSSRPAPRATAWRKPVFRSEEHTSELQSRENLVCRLLLEKKKKKYT